MKILFLRKRVDIIEHQLLREHIQKKITGQYIQKFIMMEINTSHLLTIQMSTLLIKGNKHNLNSQTALNR